MKGFKIIQESFRGWLILSYDRISVLSTPLSQESLRARGDHLLVYATATLILVTCFLWPLPLPPLLATIHCHSAMVSPRKVYHAGVSYHEDNLLGEGSVFPAASTCDATPISRASLSGWCQLNGLLLRGHWSPASSLTSAWRLISTFPMPLDPRTRQSEVRGSDPQQCS